MSTEIEKISKTAFAFKNQKGVFTLSTGISGSMDSHVWDIANGRNWETMYSSVAGKRIVSFGNANQMPSIIRGVMENNHLAPGVIQRQKGLLFGQGAFLYKYKFENGKIVREWVEDKEISKWLESWNYNKFIEKAIVEVLTMNSYFNLNILQRGHRLGKSPKIASLEFVPTKSARLEWCDSKNVDDVKHIFVGDWENNCLGTGVTTYPVFNPMAVGKSPVSASYNYVSSFGRDFYAMPSYWGAIKWILRGSDIPEIFRYVTENSINVAYHIHSPEMYWETKKEQIEETNSDWPPAQVRTELDKVRDTILNDIARVLSGKKNAGKFFESIDFVDERGHPQCWKIEPIDQKIKDFVESQIKIGEAAASAITSGMQLHPSLTNIMVNGKLASGSEMLYALKIYLNSDVRIPEMVVLNPINQAIAHNFETELRLGFYHDAILTEEQVNPDDRLKNK